MSSHQHFPKVNFSNSNKEALGIARLGVGLTGNVFASIIAVSCVAPLSRAKIVLQTQHLVNLPRVYSSFPDHVDVKMQLPYQDVKDALKRIGTREGFLRYWRGNLSHVISLFPTSLLRTFFFIQFKEWLKVPKDPIPNFKRVMAGILASTSTLVFLYPFDHVRTMLAAQITPHTQPQLYTGIWDCIRKTVSRDGILSLYRGLGISLLGIAGCTGMTLITYESLESKFHPSPSSPYFSWLKLVPAISCTLFAQTLFYPLDTIRRRLQINGTLGCKNLYTGALDCFSKIMLEEGSQALFKGAGLNIVRGTLVALIQLKTYLWFRQHETVRESLGLH